MAAKIEVVTQRQLIPHGSINGQPVYKDYGMQHVWIYNMDNTPPTIIMSGLMPSGRFEIEAGPSGGGIAGYSPYQDGGQTSGELIPKVRHIPFLRDEEATGILGH